MTGHEVLSWLLETENPSARSLALRTLLDLPPDHPQVRRAQEGIPTWGPARAILEAQWPDGYWIKPDKGYSPRHKATLWQVIFLAAMGAPLTGPIARASAHILHHSTLSDGRFSARQDARGAYPCLNGSLLRALYQLGYRDGRVDGALECVALAVSSEGYRCPGNAQRTAPGAPSPCPWGAVKVLGALAEVPAASHTPAMRTAIRIGVDLLLARDLPAARRACQVGPAWTGLEFGFPPGLRPDLLEVLEVMALHGTPPAPWARPRLSRVLQKRDPLGRWPLEHTPANTWASFGATGHAGKWVTWRALHVLRLYQAHDLALARA